MSSASTDVCTLVWPYSRQREHHVMSTAATAAGGVVGSGGCGSISETGSWIVGWNPRGLSVVVAALLPSMPYTECVSRLRRAKALLSSQATPPDVPRYRDLQVLGYVRAATTAATTTATAATVGVRPYYDNNNGTTGAPVARAVSGVAAAASAHVRQPTVLLEHNVRRLRQRRSIWVELQPGPMLGEVWCFGYRVQPCQLHVLRVEARSRLRVQPLVYTATALYSTNALRQLRRGACTALCVAGAQSCMEGVVLPAVLLRESAPLQCVVVAATTATTATAAVATATATAGNGSSAHRRGDEVRSRSRRRRDRAQRRRRRHVHTADDNGKDAHGDTSSSDDNDESSSSDNEDDSSSDRNNSDDAHDSLSDLTSAHGDDDGDNSDEQQQHEQRRKSNSNHTARCRRRGRTVSALRSDVLDVDVECSHTHSFIRPELPTLVADEDAVTATARTPEHASSTRRSTSTRHGKGTAAAAGGASASTRAARRTSGGSPAATTPLANATSSSAAAAAAAAAAARALASSSSLRARHSRTNRRRRNVKDSISDVSDKVDDDDEDNNNVVSRSSSRSSSSSRRSRSSSSSRNSSHSSDTTSTSSDDYGDKDDDEEPLLTSTSTTTTTTLPSLLPLPTTAQPLAGVPPRLNFPSSIEQAEMSITLAACAAGRVVHRTLRALDTPLRSNSNNSKNRSKNSSVDDDGSSESDDEDDACNYLRLHVPQTKSNNNNSSDEEGRYTLLLLRMVVALLSSALTLLCRVAAAAATLSRYSYTAGVVELRARELANFVAVVLGRSDACGLHPVLPHALQHSTRTARRVCVGNYVTRQLVDVLLGLQLCMLLSMGGAPLHTAAQRVSRHFLYETHMSYMNWFAGYPAGLKVNEDLNSTLCFLAKCVLNAWEALSTWPRMAMSLLEHVVSASTVLNTTAVMASSGNGSLFASHAAVVDNNSNNSYNYSSNSGSSSSSASVTPVYYWWVLPAYYVFVVISMLGASVALAFVADLASVVSLHLRLLYRAMALLFRANRVLLASLYRQFRGQRYNPLRRRLDTYDFRLDQMLHATCLFAVGICLFPTMAVYFVYFAFVRATLHAVQACLVTAAYAVLYMPLFPLLYWCAAGARLSGGVVLTSPVVTQVRVSPTLRGTATSAVTAMSSSSSMMTAATAATAAAVTSSSAAAAAGGGGGRAATTMMMLPSLQHAATMTSSSPSPAVVGNSNNSSSNNNNNGSGGGGVVAHDGDTLSHTVELAVCALPLPLHYMLTDYVAVLQTCVQLFAPMRVLLPLFTRGTMAPAMDIVAELVPHLRVDCVRPPCTLGTPAPPPPSSSS